MALNVAKEVAAMRGMTVPDLRRKYAEVFGEEARSRHKAFLIKRITWRMQANTEGGLSERARRRAEELANDVFWKPYQQPWWPQSDGNIGSWLCRTAANLGIDTLRARARRERYEQAAARAQLEAGAPADPLEEVLRAERARHVRAVLAGLKPAQAQILILRASGLSYKELAEALDIKLATVGKMLVRAEAAFEKQFRGMYGNEEAS